eukprot:TRINITY_DN34723_c0_g1_i1.p1 TRINITY_DN34723_c0_g1~~TRINITY_DN34723_c0_g1_i1.p1  ORF type:complete len:550 (+),score=99.06 TRINITY_DN34723_c0_g1_i1:42-1691(+)
MDSVANVASAVVRQSTVVVQAAADELAKQASAVASIANSSDPIAWITGEDDNDDDLLDGTVEDVGIRIQPPVPVPLAGLQSWGNGWGYAPSTSSTAFPGFQDGYGNSSGRPSPFPPDGSVNSRVALYRGDFCSLEVDALLVPAAAGYMPGSSTVFGRVLQHGGQDLRLDLRHLDVCRSGEARICKAYGLPCQRLLLTVGPKYKDKYYIAAQNTLNACYRECLQLLVESGLSTVAVPCYWYSKGYPIEEQAHVALRTIRRCLEKLHHSIEMLVLVAANSSEAELYESLLPIYFPRSEAEASHAAAVLPESSWSEWGEVEVEERRIRVSSSLVRQDDVDDRGSLFADFGDDDSRSFLNARDDADCAAVRRLEGTMIEAATPEEARATCMRYLRRARDVRRENDSTCFVYRAGKDRFDRHVVVLLGARIPALGVRDERTLPLFVKELELLQSTRFILLYVNTEVDSMQNAILEVLQEMLAVINAKYRSTMGQLLVLHPGLWFRAAFAIGRAVSDDAAAVWHDSLYLESVADLACVLDLEQLRLPEYVRYSDG